MRTAASASAVFGLCLLLATLWPALAGAVDADERDECELDAMIVFDGSGSMAGMDWVGQVSRISHVRQALRKVPREITPIRRLGLITYGPGPYNKCDNIELQLKPGRYSPAQIMSRIDALVPAGRTPLTGALEEAAEQLRYREEPAVIVLLTNGEETCGGNPCEMAHRLEATGRDVTVHVKSFMWRETATGRGILQSRCISSETGGIQMTVNNRQELIEAFRTTLACPLLTQDHDADHPSTSTASLAFD